MLGVLIFCGLFVASQQEGGVAFQKCWTAWYDRDNPSGSGDWETLSHLLEENPGKICPNPGDIQVQTVAGYSVAAAGEVIHKSDTTTGFVCLNDEQPDKKCNDYRVRFSCPPSYCDEDACWTEWYDRDNPTGDGDHETLEYLHKENPGKICKTPLAIEAQTLAGLSVAEAGEVIHTRDTTTGFVCKNEDQPDEKKCSDYRVRFSCSPPYCAAEECWTKWFDRDNPSGTGDHETLPDLRTENPGKICPKPAGIQAQTLAGLSVARAGDVIKTKDTTSGFACENKDQPDGKTCSDYRVRFSCPDSYCDTEACWTKWYDRDNPSGTGDWESLEDFHKENPGKICPKPLAIDAQTLAGLSVADTGDMMYRQDTTSGLICRNKDQPEGKMCSDYRVRFSCPPPYCDEDVCWTEWYDRDDPGGTGDWECLADFLKERPGEICEHPLYIEAVTVDTNTPYTSTGDVIFIASPSKGFFCRNEDQECGGCLDYKVRFGCPC